MGAIDDKMLKGWEKAADTLLKHSERWSVGQKVVAFAVCLIAGLALLTGIDNLRVAAGLSVVLFGVAFLTFRRRTIESEVIVLKDSRGRPRVSISGDHGLVFFDDSSRPRLIAATVEGRPMMLMTDDRERLVFGVSENGAALTLGSSDGSGSSSQLLRRLFSVGAPDKLAVTISGDEDRAAVTLTSGGSIRSGLSGTNDTAMAIVGDAEGGTVRLVAGADGNVGILLFDKGNHSPATLNISGGNARLSFFGHDGRRIATYPDEPR
jgi:hypothetical protein